jgi:branched-chain amino acid transport system substrate-binding protein
MNSVKQRRHQSIAGSRSVRAGAFVAGALACGLVIAACGGGSDSASAGSGSSEAIKLPSIQMLTGPVSFYGQLTMHGVELAVEQENADGGADIGGEKHKIDLIKEDNASDNTQTVNLLRKYCSDTNVGVLIGPTFNPNSDVGGPVTNQCGLPTVTGAGTVPTEKVNPRGYMFKALTIETDQIDATLEFAIKKLHAKRIAQITDTTDAALTGYRDENDNFLKAAGKALGASKVADVSTSAGAGNYAPQITALSSAQPDVVLINLVTADAARFMEQARGRGLKAPFAVTWGNLNDPALFSLSHGAADGMIASAPVQPASAATQSPKLQKFLEAYKAKFKKDADPLAIYTYDAVYLTASAMSKADSVTDRDRIKEALAQTKKFCNVLCYTNAGDGVLKTDAIYFTHLTEKGHVLDGETTLK